MRAALAAITPPRGLAHSETSLRTKKFLMRSRRKSDRIGVHPGYAAMTFASDPALCEACAYASRKVAWSGI